MLRAFDVLLVHEDWQDMCSSDPQPHSNGGGSRCECMAVHAVARPSGALSAPARSDKCLQGTCSPCYHGHLLFQQRANLCTLCCLGTCAHADRDAHPGMNPNPVPYSYGRPLSIGTASLEWLGNSMHARVHMQCVFQTQHPPHSHGSTRRRVPCGREADINESLHTKVHSWYSSHLTNEPDVTMAEVLYGTTT
jgi:hypothetical protein